MRTWVGVCMCPLCMIVVHAERQATWERAERASRYKHASCCQCRRKVVFVTEVATMHAALL